VSRWRCRNERCDRQIFVERLPGVAAPSARQTDRLAEIVKLFDHSAGGRPAARLMIRLGIRVSHTTIVRRLKKHARATLKRAAIRVVGVDEWGYYDDSRFFRVVTGKWVQFGMAGEPAIAQAWRAKTIADDKPGQSNRTGFVAFANTGPDTRSTQVFVNLRDNSAQNDLEPGFAPFGKIVHGMDVVEKLYAGYGETSGGGMRAGNQDALFAGGNRRLDKKFPNLDRLCKLVVRLDDFVED
jgi:cyclophilin family peptidyl-prolyl cis-trans isomerase